MVVFLSMTTTDPKAQPHRYLKLPIGSKQGQADAISAIHFTGRWGAEPLRAIMPNVVFGVDYLPAQSVSLENG